MVLEKRGAKRGGNLTLYGDGTDLSHQQVVSCGSLRGHLLITCPFSSVNCTEATHSMLLVHLVALEPYSEVGVTRCNWADGFRLVNAGRKLKRQNDQ